MNYKRITNELQMNCKWIANELQMNCKWIVKSIPSAGNLKNKQAKKKLQIAFEQYTAMNNGNRGKLPAACKSWEKLSD